MILTMKSGWTDSITSWMIPHGHPIQFAYKGSFLFVVSDEVMLTKFVFHVFAVNIGFLPAKTCFCQTWQKKVLLQWYLPPHDKSHFCILLDKPRVGPRAVSKWVSKSVTNLCSAETRVGPLHFQAGYCRRWLNLALVFGWPFVKQFAVCYQIVVCPLCPFLSVCLSVTVYCGQMVGWIKMKLGLQVGLGPVHIVRWWPSSPSPKGAVGTAPNV